MPFIFLEPFLGFQIIILALLTILASDKEQKTASKAKEFFDVAVSFLKLQQISDAKKANKKKKDISSVFQADEALISSYLKSLSANPSAQTHQPPQRNIAELDNDFLDDDDDEDEDYEDESSEMSVEKDDTIVQSPPIILKIQLLAFG